MAKRNADDSPPPALWKDTFSDLMNLLLCFFVLLFSMSTVDAAKFEELAASLSSSFSILPSGGSAVSKEGILVNSGVSQLNDLSTYYNDMGLDTDGEVSEEVESAYEEVEKASMEQSESMAEQIQSNLEALGVSNEVVEVEAYSKYVVINMNGAILFDSGRAELTAEAKELLGKVGYAIKEYDENTISVEGHTDNVPIHTAQFPNNMMLSLYRAYSVFDFFVSTMNFSEQSMTSSGRGDAVPVATNDTAEGRAQNRRVEIKIYNSLNS